MGSAGEAGDVADLDQQPGRTGGSDPVQVQQRGSGLGQQRLELFVRGLGAPVDSLEVADEFGGERRRALPAASRGRTEASRVLACAADRSFFAPVPCQNSIQGPVTWEFASTA